MTEVLLIESEDDEVTTFWLNGTEISSVNYDDHGWAGMQAVENALVSMAFALNVKVDKK